MDLKQKNQLKNQLKFKVSNYNLSIEDIEKVDAEYREKAAADKLLKMKIVVLDWALENNVVDRNELSTEKYFEDDEKLSEIIVASGLLVAGGAGSVVAVSATTVAMAGTGLAGSLGGGFLATAAANVGFGTVATTGLAAGAATVAAAAAPVVLVAVSIYAVVRYRKNKGLIQAIKDKFEEDKVELLNFYTSKINTMKNVPVIKKEKVNIVDNEKKIPITNKDRKSLNKSSSFQKDTPFPKKPVKKATKPNIKQIEKDPDYDRCIIRYDDKEKSCTIKHEDNVIDKKNGLHGIEFKNFVHKIPSIIGHDIFNTSQIEVVFIGTKTDLRELKQACKAFKESDNIHIEISFRDINKKT